MQCQHPQLGAERMPRFGGLGSGNADGNHNIAQPAPLIGGKGQDIGRPILPAKLFIEGPYALVGHKGDGKAAAGGGRRDRYQPPGQSGSTDAAAGDNFDVQRRPTSRSAST